MSNPLLQLRMYDAEKDHALLVEWCEAHGAEAFSSALLPKLGVIVQQDGKDSAALFLYMDNSCPVAWIDCAVTRPKLSAKDAIQCFGCAIEFLKSEARINGYAVILAHVAKAQARVLGRLGFNTNEGGLVRMFMQTGEN
jgi:hypothetical protein